MSKIEIEIPDESLAALRMNSERLAIELRLLAAVKLYELGRVSSGAAAALAGLSRIAFLHKLGEFGVPVLDLNAEDLNKETRLG